MQNAECKMQNVAALKNAPRAAFDASGCSDALENALRVVNARFLPRNARYALKERVEKQLWEQAHALVGVFNGAVGEDVLYLMECAGMWVLYGRPDEEAADKRLLWGFRNVDELTRLVLRLENGMRGVEDVAPYKKERLMV